jgi:hypothetical protein
MRPWLFSSCIVQSSSDDPYSLGTGGMQILQAYFNISCLSHGCWVIDIAYSKTSPSAKIALYLPRVQTDSDGVYSETFNQSYFLNKFPCSTTNLNPSVLSNVSIRFIELYSSCRQRVCRRGRDGGCCPSGRVIRRCRRRCGISGSHPCYFLLSPSFASSSTFRVPPRPCSLLLPLLQQWTSTRRRR